MWNEDSLPQLEVIHVRPQLEHDGQHFSRQGSSWLTRQCMRVSVAMASHLDSVARADPSFWERCAAQDVVDGPQVAVRPSVQRAAGRRKAKVIRTPPTFGTRHSSASSRRVAPKTEVPLSK